jgi:CO/xanthine dehydrogenase FAD-binding subunit
MQTVDVIKPDSLQEALRVRAGESVVPLAGGTDLLIRMKSGLPVPQKLLLLTGLKGQGMIEETAEEIIIGPLVMHGDVTRSELARKYLPLLVQGCATVGSPQIRNVGTLGGNIVNASPAADSVPALVALGARVVLTSIKGSREMKLEEFITGPGRTQLCSDELLTSIIVKKMRPSTRYCYKKLGRRRSLAISVASLAIKFDYCAENKTCNDPGIALGSVLPVVKRITELEELLAQQKLNDQGIRHISEQARKYCSPISDVRASADYRREMCEVLLYEARKDPGSLEHHAACISDPGWGRCLHQGQKPPSWKPDFQGTRIETS